MATICQLVISNLEETFVDVLSEGAPCDVFGSNVYECQ